MEIGSSNFKSLTNGVTGWVVTAVEIPLLGDSYRSTVNFLVTVHSTVLLVQRMITVGGEMNRAGCVSWHFVPIKSLPVIHALKTPALEEMGMEDLQVVLCALKPIATIVIQ